MHVKVSLPWSVVCRQAGGDKGSQSTKEARAVTGIRVLPVVGVRVSVTHVDASAETVGLDEIPRELSELR